MRKSAPLTLGLAFLLWMGQAHARPSFVSDELESDATRLEQNIGEDLGALASRPLPQLRKDLAQALGRKDSKGDNTSNNLVFNPQALGSKDSKAALKLSAAIVAANPKDLWRLDRLFARGDRDGER